jgi:hypothetical protein
VFLLSGAEEVFSCSAVATGQDSGIVVAVRLNVLGKFWEISES